MVELEEDEERNAFDIIYLVVLLFKMKILFLLAIREIKLNSREIEIEKN